MTHYNCTINSSDLARKLILIGLITSLSACSTTLNFTDGLIVGETAQREYNKRVALKRYQSEPLDRQALQRLLDKEV